MKLPQGFLLSGIRSGIKKGKFDLGLILCEDFAKAAGFFTANANTSYSVEVSKKHISNRIKAVLVNSGNANCFSHDGGVKDTELICEAAAKILGVKKENILIASTGIIGKRLPKEKIIKSLPTLIKRQGNNINDFSSSIMTTDTVRKISSATFKMGSESINILGFAKGSGMIYPNMATMLAFVLTDADIDAASLRAISSEAMEKSFNSISVDGCMSTNDTLFVLSSNKVLLKGKKAVTPLSRCLKKVCLDLATMIVKDAEGATKFIEIEIIGAKSAEEAKKGAMYLANSNLLKCALYGENPNWGRIIQALGQAGIELKENASVINISPLDKKEIKIAVNLKKGRSSFKVYTSDLTPEYIKINAEYT